jgi:energy-coupling factor transporter ATP-binding protein EcfA2
MVKIIGIAGRKQSGKNTVANCINGITLCELGTIMDYDINSRGELLINTTNHAGQIGWGILDLLRKDEEFVSYAATAIWPYIKIYHFADYLKKICIDLFDLTPEQVYGNDDQKNTPTNYGMTSREFLQHFGTNVMRKIKDDVWLARTIKTIQQEQSNIAIVPDVRFPNEVESIQKAGGVVIRLTRNVFNSSHECESALDKDRFNWDNFDFIVDNAEMGLKELKNKIEQLYHKI